MSTSDENPATGRATSQPMAGRRFGTNPSGPHQSEDADPIVENSQLHRMDDDHDVEPQPIDGRVRLMDGDAPPAARPSGRGLMSDVPEDTTAQGLPRPGEYPPQRPASPSAAASRADEAGGYLRLIMRVEDGVMAVVGASRVAGPLSRPGPVQGGLAYEVDLGGRQLGAGDVPDPGLRRGLASPDRPDRGHAFVEAPGYEFTARIPVDQVRMDSLPDLQITVFRLDSGQATSLDPSRPLRAQVGRAAEEVTTLQGIRAEELPQDVRASLQRALG